MHLLILFVSIAVIVQGNDYFDSDALKQKFPSPIANSASVVVYENARFTILTESLIRIEYSPIGTFDDSPTVAVINRNLPTPSFNSSTKQGYLLITTDKLLLTYMGGGPFSASNLQITVDIDGNSVVWVPGTVNSGNLFGTIRTLDDVNGSINLNCTEQTKPNLFCTFGLISTDGWVLVDDSNSPRLEIDPVWGFWPVPNPSSDSMDWYFFGHGLNYNAALSDYTLIGGQIPLPPRYAFGIFFSRYWAYSQQDFVTLLNEYETHKVPLDVLVTDMDWHETFYKEAISGVVDQAGQAVGWTGYTWDDHLFPDPDSFLQYCKSKGLRNTLNLHPASGVQPHELLYPEMAIAMGIDPATQRYVPFDITNRSYAENLHDIMLKPLNSQGIDFWWLDWQQYENTSVPNLNPTIWLNHVFFNNFQRWNSDERPMIMHRWGGLGNHRYQIGFSGDVVPSWDSLEFQVYFTATAANVGFAFWSHDIGGHTQPSPPELYTRWIQWGIFSPAFRPHCTKNPLSDRRIWTYPLENFKIMQAAINFRSQLVPYIYTSARKTHDTGIAFLRALYHDYPEVPEAYEYTTQYFFGESFMVSPIVSPVENITQIAQKNIWIPPGDWIDFYSGVLFSGPNVILYNASLSESPVFVKGGAIIPYTPMQQKPLFGSAQAPATWLGFMVFPGHENSSQYNVYDDAGTTNGYLNGEFTWTTVAFSKPTSNILVLNVLPVTGTYPNMIPNLSYEIKFVSVWPPSSVLVNGNQISYSMFPDPVNPSWTYDGNSLTTIVTLPQPYPRNSKLQVMLELPYPLQDILNYGFAKRINRANYVKVLFDNQWTFTKNGVFQEDYEALVSSSQTGQLITGQINNANVLLENFFELYENAITQVWNMTTLSVDVQQQAIAQLVML